jgi:DAK2 domain fusion protein YloV
VANNTINAALLSRMLIAGAKKLEVSKELINDLNVFPVPDGDTGTNMTLTIMSAVREVAALGDNPDMASVCKAISSGSLRGARGNSGVILSQLLRGFTHVVSEHEKITIPILADALEKAVETAYKAVMKPKEGTILTVAREGAEKARALVRDNCKDMASFIEQIIEHCDAALLNTPELLPVLKEAGVVDSGGQGLMEVLKGAYDIFLGKELDLTVIAAAPAQRLKKTSETEADIKFGYCTEFIIILNRSFNIKQELDFKAFLESIGDSIVVVADDEYVKVHVHTNDPGLAIQKALQYGALSDIKIDNMRLEHRETLFDKEKIPTPASNAEKETPPKEVAFVAVSVGEGLNAIFAGLGVDCLVEGGQTMNPSTDDILMAISKVNAEHIFLLPNNKNIILAANQAAELVNDKDVIVLPTKTVPQGISAVINYVHEQSVEENTKNMSDAFLEVKTGQVTYAVRDTVLDGHEINAGDFMGLCDDQINAVGTNVTDVAFEMVTNMVEEDHELISIYRGSEISEKEALGLKARLMEEYEDFDVELQYGGQPIYYYIVSVE